MSELIKEQVHIAQRDWLRFMNKRPKMEQRPALVTL